MQNFKSYLTEAKSNLKPWMYKTKEEIQQWLDDNKIDGFISKELEVHTTDFRSALNRLKSVALVNGKLPVQFYIATDNIYVSKSPLKSLYGLPILCGGNRIDIEGVEVTSLEGIPKFINPKEGSIEVDSKYPLKNLKGLQDDLKLLSIETCKSLEGIPKNLRGLQFKVSNEVGLKEVLNTLPDLEYIWIANEADEPFPILSIFKFKKIKEFYVQYQEVMDIVNKYRVKNDMIGCAEELIENGFKEYAKF